LVATLLALASPIALADSTTREGLIDGIETQYIATAMLSSELSSDSPVVNSVLQPAMKANPGVSSETWQSVRKETAIAMREMLTEKGGAMDVIVRSSLESFSDEELKELSHVLSDPAFKKFRAAMSAPASQQQTHAGVAKALSQVGPLINTVLVRHELNEVH
jgi:hypothetical protein